MVEDQKRILEAGGIAGFGFGDGIFQCHRKGNCCVSSFSSSSPKESFQKWNFDASATASIGVFGGHLLDAAVGGVEEEDGGIVGEVAFVPGNHGIECRSSVLD